MIWSRSPDLNTYLSSVVVHVINSRFCNGLSMVFEVISGQGDLFDETSDVEPNSQEDDEQENRLVAKSALNLSVDHFQKIFHVKSLH